MGVENSYTSGMDRVRFGRALGYGARQAVKTLVTAVDAATAESPSAKSAARAAGSASRSGAAGSSAAGSSGRVGAQAKAETAGRPPVAAKTAERVAQARKVSGGVGRGAKRFGTAVWNPFVRLSGVLWLEFVGVFFGIFALFAIGGVWKQRAAWHGADAVARQHLLGAAAMAVIFGYFCVSSFVKAHRRGRQR